MVLLLFKYHTTRYNAAKYFHVARSCHVCPANTLLVIGAIFSRQSDNRAMVHDTSSSILAALQFHSTIPKANDNNVRPISPPLFVDFSFSSPHSVISSRVRRRDCQRFFVGEKFQIQIKVDQTSVASYVPSTACSFD